VASFVLPLELLKRQNWSRHQPIGLLARVKDDLYDVMRPQAGPPREAPLPGRPFVRCIRFSGKAPDRGADTFKMAIDILCAPEEGKHRRLSFLVDDNEDDADVHQHWEPAPPGRGFGLLEVYTGALPAVWCRWRGCAERAFRVIGWNRARRGQPDDLVKAAFCRAHVAKMQSARGLTPLGLCEGAIL